MKACSLAVLCLLCASIASAAPAHRRARHRVCDPHATTLKKLRARVTSPVGPVAPPSSRVMAGLTDSTLLLQRGQPTPVDDDVAAIQNDTPADGIESGLRLAPALEPIAVLARRVDRLPKLHVAFPRSPRGPPYSA
jgi:hypothetical protein